MSSLAWAGGNSWDLDELQEPTSQIQTMTVSNIFAVLRVSCGPNLMFKSCEVFKLIFAVLLYAGRLQTLIFTVRSQLDGAADRTDITNHTYCDHLRVLQAFLHT
jgi:hypothetical protein